ncbi:MAG: hypothetical protein GEV03_00230 [Streptosporangiales bacterium]|nr:hypothetical protein [Streptosporangiales bacterium]
MGAGGFFRIECDQMHDLLHGLEDIEEELDQASAALWACPGEAFGSGDLDEAVSGGGVFDFGLAWRARGKINELNEIIESILDRLRDCLTRYEEVDASWGDAFGEAGERAAEGPSPGNVGGSGGIPEGSTDRPIPEPSPGGPGGIGGILDGSTSGD